MTQTTKQIKLQFQENGITIKEWSEANGYKVRTVLAVLNGELKCHRGISHRIAVDLGLKRPSRKEVSL